LLSRLRQVTEKAGLVSKDVETLVLQALAFQAQGHIDRAMAPLKRALALARPEGYVRVFLDEGDPLAKLLEQALARGIAVDYVSKLLAPTQVPKVSDQEATETNLKPETQEPETPWIEPLSERELQVLRLLSTGLSSTDIAEELSISVNTVRSHVRSIYGKLDVHSRYEAVARAKELGLL
jgi:LuxR family maltose regulon positive regulatory protein